MSKLVRLNEELKDKVCLIAGGSGALGAAIARKFYREGAKIAVTYLSREPVTADWQLAGGRDEVLIAALDIRNRSRVLNLVESIIARFGTIHVLVNCTGVLGPIGSLSEVSIDEWVQAVEINLLGSFALTRAVLPTMLAQSSGKIIHFSGGGAAYARPFYTAYSASKAALVRFNESLAGELSDVHIDVNTIAPGPVQSRMWDELRKVKQPDAKTIEELKKMEETGGVSPERAAELAVFLASDRSNGLTGRLISAVWDKWETFADRLPQIVASDAGTLRRIPFN